MGEEQLIACSHDAFGSWPPVGTAQPNRQTVTRDG